MKIFQGTHADGLAAINAINAIIAIIADRHTMTDPNHGNSSIIEDMHKAAEDTISADLISERYNPTDALRAKAETLLPIANVDDIEIIVLREAEAVINGHAKSREHTELADVVSAFADGLTEEARDSLTTSGPPPGYKPWISMGNSGWQKDDVRVADDLAGAWAHWRASMMP